MSSPSRLFHTLTGPRAVWIPEIVIEIVSPGSEQRDYEEKREEYLQFGVQEYWIVDAERQEVLILRRVGGRWREKIIRPPETYRTRLFAGICLRLRPGVRGGPQRKLNSVFPRNAQSMREKSFATGKKVFTGALELAI